MLEFRKEVIYMIEMALVYGAIAIMLIIIARDVIKKNFGIDIQKIDIKDLFQKRKSAVIKRTTGQNSLTMITPGQNKATVLATLRQITGIDYKHAKAIVSRKTPTKFMTGISDKEAYLTRQALEFVGAKIKINK